MRQLQAGHVAVVGKRIDGGLVAQHRVDVGALETVEQLRLRVEVEADRVITELRGAEGVRRAREVARLGRLGGTGLGGGEYDGDDVVRHHEPGMVLRAPAEEARGRHHGERAPGDVLEAHVLAVLLGQHFLAMLGEVAELDLIVERGTVVGEVVRLGHLGQACRLLCIGGVRHLAEPQPGAGAVAHHDRLHGAELLDAAHRGGRVGCEAFRRRRGRARRQPQTTHHHQAGRSRQPSSLHSFLPAALAGPLL